MNELEPWQIAELDQAEALKRDYGDGSPRVTRREMISSMGYTTIAMGVVVTVGVLSLYAAVQVFFFDGVGTSFWVRLMLLTALATGLCVKALHEYKKIEQDESFRAD